MKISREITMAEQQLLGFCHAKKGYSLIELVEAMGLSKYEWDILKENYGLLFMTYEQIEELDKFFKLK